MLRKTKKALVLIALILTASLLMASCGSDKDPQEARAIDEFELEYGLYRFPSPYEPMSYVVTVDFEGTLSKEYVSADMYEGDFDKTTKQLSTDELMALIDVIEKNGFFKLPENVDGNTNITDQDSRSLTITYNGETHKCNGYNTMNQKYLRICAYIEELAQ